MLYRLSREAWQYVLSRHHLTERGEELVKVVKDVGGLHAQDFLSAYLALWNRVSDFRTQRLDEELFQKRTLVLAHLMRVTLHVVSKDEFPLYFQATREALRKFLKQRGIVYPPRLGEVHKEVLKFLDGQKRSTSDIRKHLKKRGLSTQNLNRILHYELAGLGLIVRAGRKVNLNEWARLEDWLGESIHNFPREEEAKRWLVKKYIESFGPVTEEEIQSWTWFNLKEIEALLSELAKEGIISSSIEGKSRFWHIPSVGLMGDAASQFHVWVLPEFDPLTVGLRKRWWPLIRLPPLRGNRRHPAPGIVLTTDDIPVRWYIFDGLQVFFRVNLPAKTVRYIAKALREMPGVARKSHMILNKISVYGNGSSNGMLQALRQFMAEGWSLPGD